MNSIDLLVQEHENILRMLDVIRAASLQALGGAPIDVDDFRAVIAFVRLYADKAHHGKEEDFLFREILSELGAMGANLVRHGMLVEHDMGRLYIADLEDALDRHQHNPSDESRLDILVAAGSYRALLKRHIEKENSVVFPFGGQRLSPEALARVETQTEDFEKDARNMAVRAEQLRVLDVLSKKYIGQEGK